MRTLESCGLKHCFLLFFVFVGNFHLIANLFLLTFVFEDKNLFVSMYNVLLLFLFAWKRIRLQVIYNWSTGQEATVTVRDEIIAIKQLESRNRTKCSIVCLSEKRMFFCALQYH